MDFHPSLFIEEFPPMASYRTTHGFNIITLHVKDPRLLIWPLLRPGYFSINCMKGRFHLFLLSYTLFYDLPTYLPTYLPNLAASFIYTGCCLKKIDLIFSFAIIAGDSAVHGQNLFYFIFPPIKVYQNVFSSTRKTKTH